MDVLEVGILIFKSQLRTIECGLRLWSDLSLWRKRWSGKTRLLKEYTSDIGSIGICGGGMCGFEEIGMRGVEVLLMKGDLIVFDSVGESK